MRLDRRSVLLATAGAITLAACGQTGANAQGGGRYDRPGDMALGAGADAKVTLVEYASITCSHCADFHEKTWPLLKAEYIDTGKIRFIFREFPTSPPELAAGGFQVARCGNATPEQYYARLDTLFKQQRFLFDAYGRGAAREGLRTIALAAGIQDAQFEACVRDEAGYKRINESVEYGVATYKITGTPSFVLNGTLLTDPGVQTIEGLRVILDRAIAEAK